MHSSVPRACRARLRSSPRVLALCVGQPCAISRARRYADVTRGRAMRNGAFTIIASPVPFLFIGRRVKNIRAPPLLVFLALKGAISRISECNSTAVNVIISRIAAPL